MDKIPFQKCTYTFSDEQIAEIEKSTNKYAENAIQIVDNDDTLTLYESVNDSYWVCRKCSLSFECKEHSAHYCPNCGRKIYDFIKG